MGAPNSSWRLVASCGVLSLCLASLVHHKAFLVTALPPKHPLLSSVLFGDASAAAIVGANVALTSQTIQPTGIPPHVDLHSQIDQSLAVVRALPSAIRESIGVSGFRPVHYWGGRWHLLPETFELPSVDVATAWHLWWCGSPARDIPPLFKISSRDLTKKEGKILCEWNFAVVELQKVGATGGKRTFVGASENKWEQVEASG
ncbi:hypothetical protein H257_11519 [Aphanomyces astaci]|uniref:Uncharacterized protein n=1 Tax=Aphanomyces astaci TaxID=112090 RepID=W4G486_APHAT|nr:hypothetical protein H257_11519 [Aphanomyces astaci]ETV73859.1 hypothetical protein H257_11519 [Aphanomyces astaci]|eukprot:XP_009836795.1 hypothetical protein H257_11519 [Aphanomyces astaci]